MPWLRKEEDLTSGCALMIASLLVRCGSSVYVQKKSSFLSDSFSVCAAAAAAPAAPFNVISPSGTLPLAFLLSAPALVVVVAEFAIVCACVCAWSVDWPVGCKKQSSSFLWVFPQALSVLGRQVNALGMG